MTVKVGFSINTVELEVKYECDRRQFCLRTSATQFSATTSISTLEPITGRKSETEIPRFSLVRDWSKRVTWANIPQLKLGNI